MNSPEKSSDQEIVGEREAQQAARSLEDAGKLLGEIDLLTMTQEQFLILNGKLDVLIGIACAFAGVAIAGLGVAFLASGHHLFTNPEFSQRVAQIGLSLSAIIPGGILLEKGYKIMEQGFKQFEEKLSKNDQLNRVGTKKFFAP